MGLTRLRITLVGLAGLVIALAAGGVFDRTQWSLLLAPGVPVIVGLAAVRGRAVVRAALAALAVIAGTALVVALEGGGFGDVVASFGPGVQRLLTTDWPSPDRPDLVGTIGATIALLVTVAVELAQRRRWHLLPLTPLIVGYVAVLAASAPLGARLGWLVPLGVIAVVFTTLRSDSPLGERLHLLRGERRLLPLVGVAALVAGLVSIPVSLGARADPRRNDPPERTASLLDPIEATLALRALDPPIDLHEIAGDGPFPARWRTAALENYDGQRWAPALTLRPIGRTLGAADGVTVDAEIRFLDDDLALVPLPGRPVTIDGLIETDPDRTIVRLAGRPDPDESIAVTSNVAPVRAAVAPGSLGTREIDENVSGLTELAETLAGDGTILERLGRLEQTMRTEFILDSDAPGGGLQRALVERFLRDTERGNAEQFATAFVLLARSLGVDARVATGFVVEPVTPGDPLVLRSSDAAIWPEVRIVDDGWLAFDPVPPEETSDASTPPPEPQVQTPAAPQPPIAPPPESANDSPVDETAATDDARSTLSAVGRWVVRVGGIAGIAVLPLVLLALVVLGIKWRRRRRRLRVGSDVERIRGAWAVATDALVDAGLTIERSRTDLEIAGDGSALVDTADRELRRLAALSSLATYGVPTRADYLAEDALSCLGQIEKSLAEARTTWRRLRWRMSLRSLRSATRSPVAP